MTGGGRKRAGARRAGAAQKSSAASPRRKRADTAAIAAAQAALADFAPPSKRALRALFAPARAYFKPQFLGLDALDLSRPALFVGNHTRFGITDVPLLAEHLYTRHDVLLRGLGDREHFRVPLWRDLLARLGVVLATPENCAALMRRGAHVLVFPGGAREVMRRKHESYRLIWKQRTGFARLAIEHGYDIVPFGAVGPDEAFRIVFDAGDVMRTRLFRAVAKRWDLGRAGDYLPPFPIGLGPTPLPRPQRYYFGFGARIATRGLDADDEDAVWQLREQVADAVEAQITRLFEHRRVDRPKSWSRLRRALAPVAERP